jgi:hypothetical protein
MNKNTAHPTVRPTVIGDCDAANGAKSS